MIVSFYKIKLFAFLMIILVLQGCFASYVKNQEEVKALQLETGKTENITICSNLIANQNTINTYAKYICLRTGQESKIVAKTRFSDCSFANPVATEYECF